MAGDVLSGPFHPDRVGCECAQRGISDEAECIFDDPCWESRAAWERQAGKHTGGSAASPELARELAALRVERNAAVEALKDACDEWEAWMDGAQIGDFDTPADDDWKALAKARAALAAASRSSTEPPQTDLGGEQSSPSGARADV